MNHVPNSLDPVVIASPSTRQSLTGPVPTSGPVGVAGVRGGGTLRGDGYARLPGASLGVDAKWAAGELTQFAQAYEGLPRDPYAPHANRYRRYSHAVYLPWKDELSFIPGVPDAEYGSTSAYWQDEHNREFPRIRRRLPDLPTALHSNQLLNAIIRADLAEALWLPQLHTAPVYIGIHMVRLAVRDQAQVAMSSPNCLHQDGGSPALCTFAHLIGRRNIHGGENIIATADSAGRQPGELSPSAIHARFVLSEPLDGYGVHDQRVAHYVAPVRLADAADTGHRDILLLGIAPFIPGM
ncbi:2OG-Fe dioxygenase family protein [Streptomyces sp. NPDC053560]|uniref:2OG-Fe dioxygenase family protein n=1 Tax=Streptomyces sp. NPDC053560 TaxID=3365711 RepID=UPI0037CD32ED